MAHRVEKMFSVREMPWHFRETGADGRAVILDSPPRTWEEFRVVAGLDWDPIEEVPFRRTITFNSSGEPEEKFEQVPGHNWIARSDNGRILDSAIDSYELITNTDMGDIINTMMDGHKLEFETGGCLEDGRKVWALLRMGDFLEVVGDPSPTVRYIALLNAHDGHGACKAIATNVRVVCANTWHYADTESKAGASCFSFHHRANWRQHLKHLQDDVKAALSGATKEMQAYAELADELIQMPVTAQQEARFVEEAIFHTSREHKLKPRALENVTVARQELALLLQSPTCEGLAPTAYRLMQAAGEWTDHVRGFRSARTYLNRTVFTASEFKANAKNLAVRAHRGLL